MTQTLSQTVAARIRRLRDERSWSAARLSERCAELGLDLPRDVIANIENGRRTSVTVEELIGLALALDTSPVVLLLPLGDEERVSLTQTMTMHPHLALEWFAGEEYAQYFHVDEPWDGERLPHGQDRAAWLSSTRALRYFRNLRTAQEEMHDAAAAVHRAEFTKDTTAEQDARSRYAATLEAMAEVRSAMRDAGLATPSLHPQTASDMAALGIAEA